MLHRFFFFAATAALLALTTHRVQAQDVCALCEARAVLDVPPNANDSIVQEMWEPYYKRLRDSFSLANSKNQTVLNVLDKIEQANAIPANKKPSEVLSLLAKDITEGLQYQGYDANALRDKFSQRLAPFEPKEWLTKYYAQKYALACVFACFAHKTYVDRPDHPDVPEMQRERYRPPARTSHGPAGGKPPSSPPTLHFCWLGGLAIALAVLCIYLQLKLQNATEKIKKLEELLNPKPDVAPPVPDPSPNPTPPLPGSKENPLPALDEKKPDTGKIQWVDDSSASTKPGQQSLTLYASHPNGGIFYSFSPQFDHNLYMFRIVLPNPNAREADLMLMDDSDVLRRTFSDLHTNLQSVAELYGVGQPSASIPYTVKPGRVVRHGENWQLKSKMELTW
jgi:hypothetical protein